MPVRFAYDCLTLPLDEIFQDGSVISTLMNELDPAAAPSARTESAQAFHLAERIAPIGISAPKRWRNQPACRMAAVDGRR